MSDDLAAASTEAPAKKKSPPINLLVCLYEDDVATVYLSLNYGKAKAVRDKLRTLYGTQAQFHIVTTLMPPARWTRWEAEIRADLGLPPRESEPAVGAPAETSQGPEEAGAP